MIVGIARRRIVLNIRTTPRNKVEKAIASLTVFLLCGGIAWAIWPFLAHVAGAIAEHPAAIVPTMITGLGWLTFVYAAVAFPVLIWVDDT